MKKQNNKAFITRAVAVSISLAITGSALASETVLTRSTGAPVGNN